MMLKDLQLLLEYVHNANCPKDCYLKAIIEDNCLKKRSQRTRVLSSRHLVYLYSLEPVCTIFRALRYFWARDSKGHPLLALLCSYSRDSLLRVSAPFILEKAEGMNVSRQSFEEYIEEREPGRFSRATLKSLAQNLNATWTDSQHLIGKA